MEFKKRFSIAHPEQDMQQYPNHYYLILKNTPEETLDEIDDIYFGKNFYYEFRRQRKFVGNAMGQEATDEHIDNLLRIQDELGVEVSLTVNQTIWPDELILDEEYLEGYYDSKGQNAKYNWSLFLNRLEKAYQRGTNEIIDCMKK